MEKIQYNLCQHITMSNASLNDSKLSGKDKLLTEFSSVGSVQSNVVKNAVFQMKKDGILHEYQYFVGAVEN